MLFQNPRSKLRLTLKEKKYGRFKHEKRENFRNIFFSEFFFAMISQRYHLLIMIRGDHGG